MGLNLRRRAKKRVPVRYPASLETPPISNYIWAMDFMEDRLYLSRRSGR
jgi:hypothetical protein